MHSVFAAPGWGWASRGAENAKHEECHWVHQSWDCPLLGEMLLQSRAKASFFSISCWWVISLQWIYQINNHNGSVGLSASCLLSTDNFTEELLNLHEAEVKTLEKYYIDHQELFEGVTKWRENWTLYLELDVSTIIMNLVGRHSKQTSLGVLRCGCVYFPCQKKANDPGRFNNRGGNLLKEEKQRTDLQKSLPKVRKCSNVCSYE